MAIKAGILKRWLADIGDDVEISANQDGLVLFTMTRRVLCFADYDDCTCPSDVVAIDCPLHDMTNQESED